MFYYLPEDFVVQENNRDKASEKVTRNTRNFLDFSKVLLTRSEEICNELLRTPEYRSNRFLECIYEIFSYYIHLIILDSIPLLLSRMLAVTKEMVDQVEEVLGIVTPVLKLVDQVNLATVKGDADDGPEPIVKYPAYTSIYSNELLHCAYISNQSILTIMLFGSVM